MRRWQRRPAADVTAEPEYSGTLSLLTKFGGEPLEPYFEDLAAEYTELHPDVTFELIQETDQSVKDKTKTLTASGALPDIYFTWTGNWAQNFIDGGLAADLTEVIAPTPNGARPSAKRRSVRSKSTASTLAPALQQRQVHGLQQGGLRGGRH